MHDVQPARVAGPDRVGTAAEIAELVHDEGSDHAIIARSDDFPDSLAAAAFARVADAPILLTRPDELPERTREELEQLEVSNVSVFGGPNAVSPQVEAELRAEGYNVDRVFGPNRYATSATAAERVAAAVGVGTIHGERAVFLANGEHFPDALSASSPAATRDVPVPVLLTRQGEIPQETQTFLDDHEIAHVILVGGPDAISDDVERSLDEQGRVTERVHGANRSETSVAVANFAAEHFDGYHGDRVALARGDAFPDALAAGPMGGYQDAPVLLTPNPDQLGREVEAWLRSACEDVSVIRAVGGPNAVTTSTLEAAERAAEECDEQRDRRGESSYIVAPQEARDVQVGERPSWDVNGRYDGREVYGPVNIAMFPSDAVVQEEGSTRFEHAHSHAVMMAESDTGAAHLAEDGSKMLHDRTSDDGTITFDAHADAADSAWIAVWKDTDGDDQIDVDRGGYPTEAFGMARVTWS